MRPLSKHLTDPRHGWFLGLPVLGLLWIGATLVAEPRIERAIEGAGRLAAIAEGGSDPWLRVHAEGRQLVAGGEAPDAAARDAALARLARLEGPRTIRSEIGLIVDASPFVWTAVRETDGAIAVAGSRPAEIGARHLTNLIVPEATGSIVVRDEARAARGAPPDFAVAAAYAVARLRQLAPGASVSITDTGLSLRGAARSLADYDTLRRALAEPPLGFRIDRAEILPPTVSDFQLAVERRRDGGLVLDGNVPSEAARGGLRALAAEAAEGAFVDDRTRAARGLPADLDADALARALVRVAGLLSEGRVRYEGGRISVSGDALDPQAREEIASFLRADVPSGVSAGDVALTVRPLSPYRVVLRRDADSVTLSGHLPDAATRDRLRANLTARLYRERVVDRLRIADGAPEGLSEALAPAVSAFALLVSGELAVSDRTLSLRGESLYAESGARLAETLTRAMPRGWTVQAAVETRDGREPRQDADSCRALFQSEATDRRLRFEPGSALLKASFYPPLDALAALAKRCPDLKVAVLGPTDPPGSKPIPEKDPEPAPAAAADTKKPSAKPAPSKAQDKAQTKTPAQKPDTAAQAKPAVPDEPSLARQRALALTEYLMTAGMRTGQLVPGDTAAPEAVFELR